MTREQAVTMLVRLLGAEDAAKAGSYETPFTDVAPWAQPYVGYAYANGLTKGTGKTRFGGSDIVTTSQYLTFVLRALGYESGTDFQWDSAWTMADALGLDAQALQNTTTFLRGDMAEISLAALESKTKGGAKSLLQSLVDTGAVNASAAAEAGLITVEPLVHGDFDPAVEGILASRTGERLTVAIEPQEVAALCDAAPVQEWLGLKKTCSVSGACRLDFILDNEQLALELERGFVEQAHRGREWNDETIWLRYDMAEDQTLECYCLVLDEKDNAVALAFYDSNARELTFERCNYPLGTLRAKASARMQALFALPLCEVTLEATGREEHGGNVLTTYRITGGVPDGTDFVSSGYAGSGMDEISDQQKRAFLNASVMDSWWQAGAGLVVYPSPSECKPVAKRWSGERSTCILLFFLDENGLPFAQAAVPVNPDTDYIGE